MVVDAVWDIRRLFPRICCRLLYDTGCPFCPGRLNLFPYFLLGWGEFSDCKYIYQVVQVENQACIVYPCGNYGRHLLLVFCPHNCNRLVIRQPGRMDSQVCYIYLDRNLVRESKILGKDRLKRIIIAPTNKNPLKFKNTFEVVIFAALICNK